MAKTPTLDAILATFSKTDPPGHPAAAQEEVGHVAGWLYVSRAWLEVDHPGAPIMIAIHGSTLRIGSIVLSAPTYGPVQLDISTYGMSKDGRSLIVDALNRAAMESDWLPVTLTTIGAMSVENIIQITVILAQWQLEATSWYFAQAS